MCEWENGINTNVFKSSFENYDYIGQFTDPIPINKSITDFLASTSKTNQLNFGPKSKLALHPVDQLFLIEDLPNTSNLVTRNAVHLALRQYSSYRIAYPLVFIISNVSRTDDEQSNDIPITIRSLLPPEYRHPKLWQAAQFRFVPSAAPPTALSSLKLSS